MHSHSDYEKVPQFISLFNITTTQLLHSFFSPLSPRWFNNQLLDAYFESSGKSFAICSQFLRFPSLSLSLSLAKQGRKCLSKAVITKRDGLYEPTSSVKLTPGIRSSSAGEGTGTRNSNKLLVDGACCTQVLRGRFL